MPTGAMMQPMQPIMQVGATMAPPVAGTKTEGTTTTPATTATTTTMAPVMMASNNCCCDNYNMNSRGGFRRGFVLRRW
jgi:hypothetical protein